jgi:hypothetical protein
LQKNICQEIRDNGPYKNKNKKLFSAPKLEQWVPPVN